MDTAAGGSPSGGDRRGAQDLIFRRATTPADLEKVFRLRYQVYVVERGFERPEDHPGEFERDAFDDVALHFLCERPDGLAVGTLRLILPSRLGFPIEVHCPLSIDPARLPRDRTGEISRLAVTHEYQRRREDPFNPSPPAPDEEMTAQTLLDRRRTNLVMGLYREMFRATKRSGLTHWYAAMEHKLWVSLARFGFDFQAIGPYVDYHGRRAPFLAEVSAIERNVTSRFPGLWRYLIEGM